MLSTARRWGRCNIAPLRIGRCANGGLPSNKRHNSDLGSSSSRVVFSGIQPTGVPHLGNYLGALKQWVDLQDSSGPGTFAWCLVDLHALTIRHDPERLRQYKIASLAMLLAIGLDPAKSMIYYQSDVSAHAELMWILSCQARTGYLGRMVQWKEKTANQKSNPDLLRLGLFSYPVLQAADVLAHFATHVPVGEDQAQHLEFTRELASGFNSRYGQLFPIPETLISPAKRIMSLNKPLEKMSKSNPREESRILLTDDDGQIGQKIASAMTDSLDGVEYDPTRRPGVSNLIDLLYYTDFAAGYGGQHDVARDLQGLTWKAVKRRVAESVIKVVRPIRERYDGFAGEPRRLVEIARDGAQKASQRTAKNLRLVRDAIGLEVDH